MMCLAGVENILFDIISEFAIKKLLSVSGNKNQMYHKKISVMPDAVKTMKYIRELRSHTSK
jgi:hypothetical protein